MLAWEPFVNFHFWYHTFHTTFLFPLMKGMKPVEVHPSVQSNMKGVSSEEKRLAHVTNLDLDVSYWCYKLYLVLYIYIYLMLLHTFFLIRVNRWTPLTYMPLRIPRQRMCWRVGHQIPTSRPRRTPLSTPPPSSKLEWQYLTTQTLITTAMVASLSLPLHCTLLQPL